MKNLCVIIIFVFITFSGISQVSVNDTGDEPDSSAMLDVQSSTKGLLIPRMTTTERDAIEEPAEGLLLFNTSMGAFNFYVNSEWRVISGDGCLRPDVPGTITGNDSVCNNSESVEYSVPSAFGADYYLWTVEPPGELVNYDSSNTAYIDFGPSSNNLVQISVKSVNDCGVSYSTSSKNVNLLDTARYLQQPIDQYGINGGNVTFSVDYAGDAVQVQWQESQGTGFYDIIDGGIYSGATTKDLQLTGISSSMNDYEYRCLLITICGPDLVSDTAVLYVDQYQCGVETVEDADGNVYNTVPIGSQCWFKENLKVGEMINADINQTNNQQIEKYCYNNFLDNCDTYGGLYQWNEMMQYTTIAGVQGICPEGWHLPTQSEYNQMINYLGGNNTTGGKLKETGTVHWWPPNTGATNESGFTGLPGGQAWSGSFLNLTTSGYFYTSSQQTGSKAYYIFLYYDYNSVSVYDGDKIIGMSVRCVKDSD